MKWLNQLERKYSKYAIPNLIQYIVGGMALVFVFGLIYPEVYTSLYFSPTLVMQGQIWRVLTFLFLPRTDSPFWILFSLLFTFFIGKTLEQAWGTFKFNIYYLIGALGTIIAAFIVEVFLGSGSYYTNYYLNMSLFLALATVIPEYEIRIYMILPVKLKYLGYIYGVILGLQLLSALIIFDVATIITILVSLGNYMLFFGPGLLNKQKNHSRKQQFKQANRPQPKARPNTARTKPGNGKVIQVAFHCCEVCGKTEVDDPELEFRYCSKCEGRHEYCTEHILNHEHMKM